MMERIKDSFSPNSSEFMKVPFKGSSNPTSSATSGNDERHLPSFPGTSSDSGGLTVDQVSGDGGGDMLPEQSGGLQWKPVETACFTVSDLMTLLVYPQEFKVNSLQVL